MSQSTVSVCLRTVSLTAKTRHFCITSMAKSHSPPRFYTSKDRWPQNNESYYRFHVPPYSPDVASISCQLFRLAIHGLDDSYNRRNISPLLTANFIFSARCQIATLQTKNLLYKSNKPTCIDTICLQLH